MPVEPLSAPTAVSAVDPLLRQVAAAPAAPSRASFSQMLVGSLEQVDQKLVDADALAAAFAVDDSIPVHRVTYALEQARLSFELMLQVRARLVEAYQEVARMQL